MSRTFVPSQPLAELRRQLTRTRQAGPLPTGEVTTASSTWWAATATASATPHTKGAWTEVVSATTVDIYGLQVYNSGQTSVSGSDSSLLLDVGVGGSGSEQVVIQDLAYGWRIDKYLEYRVPVLIPAGSRIAVRCQSAVASNTCGVLVVPMARTYGSTRPSTTVAALNSSTATSKGTNLSVPATAHTKGSWTQLVAATTEPYTAIMAGIQGGQDTVQGSTTGLVDIAVGASGSEVTVVGNIYVATTTGETVSVPDAGAWLVDIPAGSRIAARFQEGSTNSSLDVIVYGIR